MTDSKKDESSQEQDEEQSAEAEVKADTEDSKSSKNNDESVKDKGEENKEETKSPDEEKPVENVEEAKEEPPELTREDIIKILKSFPGVGEVLAARIFEAGFDSREKLLSIELDELKKLQGMGHALAENITTGMGDAIKQFETPTKKEDKTSGPGITDKAFGFIKGSISKITGFFKGKLPKPKPKSESPSGKTVSTETKEPGEPGAPDQGPEPGAEKDDKSGTGEGVEKDEEYFPEVGSPEAEPEQTTEHEPVTIEASNEELEETPEPDSEPKREPEPEPEPEQKPMLEEPTIDKVAQVIEKEPEISLNDSSGLLKWFESSPNLKPETGKLIFKAGYNNLAELKEAVVDDLVLIKGVTQQDAKDIFDELKRLN